MDRETLLTSLQGSIDSRPDIRKQSEAQLRLFEQQPGFTAYLLDLMLDNTVSLGIQMSAAILFKNRVANYWVIPETRTASALAIGEEEKSMIKEKIIQTLIHTFKNNQIKLQLSTSIHNILAAEKWDELNEVMHKLISDSSNVDHVYAGLICLFEYTKNYRWAGLETSNSSNPVLEVTAETLFPLLEELVPILLEDKSQTADEMLYLIVKIFKFTTFSSLPTYLRETSRLGKWCHLQILIINSPLPDSIMQEDSLEVRSLHPRVKCVKWCFGNLHRLLTRHGGGMSTKEKESNEFARSFLENFVPEILNVYWSIIENWSNKKIWLSEGSLYHMISFLEQLIDTPAWQLISDKLEAIILHVVLPTLNANEQTIELYEDEPEEYIRKFFDVNRESNTADVASTNFIFRLSVKKFKFSVNKILNIINDIFNKRAADRSNLNLAMQTEGALRILSTISYKLDKNNSPVKGQLDQVLFTFVYPELSSTVMVQYPWLTARACDTLAMFLYDYQDQEVLRHIFEAIIICFQNKDQFPIQITSVDALRTLVDQDSVAVHIAEQAPQLMGTLLEMSQKFESDILTNVMDSFVEKFASNLEPYAVELASRLVDQFLKLAHDLLEQQVSGPDSKLDLDKEYQASGILNTLTTLVIAMNSSPSVGSSLEPVIQSMANFVLDNAMVSFLSEIVEILESILFSTQNVSQVLWELFKKCLDAFDLYAQEYFDNFQPFFESVINNGFISPDITVENVYVQELINVCFKVLKGDSLDPIFADSAFELIELTILALGPRISSFLSRLLPEVFEVFMALEAQEVFDGYMLHHLSVLKIFFACIFVDANTTVSFLNERQFLDNFIKLWTKYSTDFQSVFGCKLQIIASLNFLSDVDKDILPGKELTEEVRDLLLSNLEVLPHAIKAREEILSQERGVKSYTGQSESQDNEDDEYEGAYLDEEDFEADEAELEAMKQTPIDEVNVFELFMSKIKYIQNDSQKYSILFGNLTESQQSMVSRIAQVHEQSQHGAL